jgi:hypothetical protein
VIAAVVAIGLSAGWPIVEGAIAPAQAQSSVSVEFREALQPFGRWEHHSRWGDVWIPAERPRDWRPYTVGRWAYTDDWGWYWASDQQEDAWGWVVYHYGHWVLDADFGWIWVPGDEWGPGWVQWRRGTQHIGWAPLPPDERIEVEYRERPEVWVFVRIRDFTAPRIFEAVLPPREYPTYVRETVIENRTVEFRDSHFAVNPGIAPSVIAAIVGRPIRSFEVRPRVLTGTARINGAIEVRREELARLRDNRESFRESLRESQREFTPAGRVPPPQALGANERGRLGDNPPRAAERVREGQPATSAPMQQQGQGQQQPGTQAPAAQEQQRGRQPQGTQGLVPPREQRQQGAAPQEEQRRQPPSTQGLVPPRDQRQQGAAPQEEQRRQPPSTQGLVPPRDQRQQGAAPQEEQRRQPPSTQGLVPPRDQRQQGAAPQEEQRRQPPSTQGLVPPHEQRQQGAAPQEEQRRQPPSTQGLGGGGQREMQPQNRAPQIPQPQTEGGRPAGGGEQRGSRRPGGAE